MKRIHRALAIAALLTARQALAETINDVLPAALDQPQINAALTLTPGLNASNVLTADFGGGITSFNIEAYFDTGASGILLSEDTADSLGLTRATFNGQPITFNDTGAVGSDQFNVSQPVYIHLAPFTPAANVDDPTDFSAYTQNLGPVRTEIGPIGSSGDPFLGDIDVIGVPAMQNKVVVMDPKPVNTFVDSMRTTVYNSGDSAIPTTQRHVRLTKVDFSQFTQASPAGAPGPTLNGNPFIGSNPITGVKAGDPPPVSISLNSLTATGNFLLDTGSAASMISTTLAADLHVRYVAGTFGTLNPELEIYDPAHPNNPTQNVPGQFTLDIGGIGGTERIAGFYLDSLTLPTVEGQSNPNNNLKFQDAPVLVNDITLTNPQTSQPLTLDGVFGMNFLVASALIEETDPVPTIDALAPGNFDTIVYDDSAQTLGLTVGSAPVVSPTKYWLGPDSTTGSWNTTSGNWFDLNTFDLSAKYKDGDDIEFLDSSVLTDCFNVVIDQTVLPNSVTIDNSEQEATFNFSGAGHIGGTASLYKSGGGLVVMGTSNTYTGTTDISGGTIEFTVSQNIGPVLVREQSGLIMDASQHFQGLRLDDGHAKLASGGNKFISTTSLDISGTGQLDIGDGDVIITDKGQTPEETIRQDLLGGRNGGAWNGPGITSSVVAANPNLYSIGYADNADLGRANQDGEPLDGSDLIVQFTYAGDANLDGMVDIRDLYLMALNFGKTDSFWINGDFNYDGVVNAADLSILALNWQRGVSGPLLSDPFSELAADFGLPPAAVPEPTALGFLGLSIVALGSRRLRRSVWRI